MKRTGMAKVELFRTRVLNDSNLEGQLQDMKNDLEDSIDSNLIKLEINLDEKFSKFEEKVLNILNNNNGAIADYSKSEESFVKEKHVRQESKFARIIDILLGR